MIVRNGESPRGIQQQNLATRLCQSKLHEVAAGVWPLTSQDDTPFDEEPDYTWSLDAENSSFDGLWKVTVTRQAEGVRGGDAGPVQLTQMVLDPSVIGSNEDVVPVTSSTDQQHERNVHLGQRLLRRLVRRLVNDVFRGELTCDTSGVRGAASPCSKSSWRLAIAVLLLGALYVAVDMQLRSAQNSRDTVQGSTLSARVMSPHGRRRLAGHGPERPRPLPLPGGPRHRSDRQPGGGRLHVGRRHVGRRRVVGRHDIGDVRVLDDRLLDDEHDFLKRIAGQSLLLRILVRGHRQPGATNIVLPFGVIGDTESLHLFVSSLPREIYASGANLASSDDSDAPPPVSDLRRISYWLAGGGDSPGRPRPPGSPAGHQPTTPSRTCRRASTTRTPTSSPTRCAA